MEYRLPPEDAVRCLLPYFVRDQGAGTPPLVYTVFRMLFEVVQAQNTRDEINRLSWELVHAVLEKTQEGAPLSPKTVQTACSELMAAKVGKHEASRRFFQSVARELAACVQQL